MDLAIIDNYYSQILTSAGYFNMNYSNSNSGGWASCKMRTALLASSSTPLSAPSGSFMAALPSDLKAVMKSCVKYSDNTGGGSNNASYVTSTTDFLWCLSEYEALGTISRSNSAEKNYQQQYAYYASGNSRAKYLHNDQSTLGYWMLRSVCASNATDFVELNRSGSAGTNSAYGSSGISPAFCV